MKITELRELSTDELASKRREFKEEFVTHLSLQQQSGQLENPARIRFVRRTVARIETLLSERRKQAASS
ncbi:MAG: 50S ribosomal protein L29 [Verrucomicrobiaceae bacterium]|jgi:large subunit ribosomal protein L29|nr:50S ribosomal protein L29 [Verrucomicrobiales bacterium]NCF84819.1 50S ribosomal protein L29 [Verrucomicrobiaceae bacterium]MDB2347257.1 50S ribosomal protein L29 [Verrucomicrobiales bacterium]MDB4789271.1 50S ribosomal protein L29 [Verrucomicrobiales bacterium]MDC0504504.1 50S ribosomal protein L29 [Verrucomicrobiales bacterium]